MIEPELNSSTESLKAADAATEAVLAHADDWESERAAVEIKGAARRLEAGDAEPCSEDSTLTVSVLAVGSLGVECGGETDEVVDELEQIADTLEEGGWDALKAVNAL